MENSILTNKYAMKKILITGSNGQLGSSLQQLSGGYPRFQFLFTDVDTLDICDAEAVNAFVQAHEVSYIVNCAAYTAVDKAEEDADLCTRINRDAVQNLGQAARLVGAKVIHVSTDYVFDGTNHRPYVESDSTCPISVYGHTKLAGEQLLQAACPHSVIIRTAWLYSTYGNNFVKTVLRLGSERDELRFIFDQVGTPTSALDLAAAILHILEQGEAGHFHPGIYHYSNEGVCSWYDFATKVVQLAGLKARVLPIETKEYPTLATRPPYSVLNKTKIKVTYGLAIPHWEESLRVCLAQLIK